MYVVFVSSSSAVKDVFTTVQLTEHLCKMLKINEKDIQQEESKGPVYKDHDEYIVMIRERNVY